jgi:hypothetical protein
MLPPPFLGMFAAWDVSKGARCHDEVADIYVNP